MMMRRRGKRKIMMNARSSVVGSIVPWHLIQKNESKSKTWYRYSGHDKSLSTGQNTDGDS